jgi:hypothetical protein
MADVIIPAGRRRETIRNRTTTAAIAAPTMVPLKRMWRNSDRSGAAVVVAGIGFLSRL